ncbi:uncharacterized protein LOC132087705 [Daphnia carinata]|uniref:uncharacterized protein LOC132087705 n=1 Tax=Daphnia carinata TaxID=120202 RepID=UPI00257D9240|nr:uncharacterized protein LOC132087705 [Daphnia carinata]
MHISPARRIILEIASPTFFPYERSGSRNVLQLFDARPAATNIKTLFLGCEDLQKALETTVSQSMNPRTLHYHITGTCLTNIARNVLMVKIISSPEFDPVKNEDLEYIWEVWYGVYWSSPEMSLRFKTDIKDLLNGNLPANMEVHPGKCLQSLKWVWKEWLLLVDSKKSDNIEAILHARSAANRAGWCAGLSKDMTEEEQDFELVRRIAVHMGVEHFPEPIKTAVIFEAHNFFFELDNGIPGGCKGKFINPTLLETKSKRWIVHHTVSPFNSYLPLPLNNALDPHKAAEGCAVTHYCQNVLLNQLILYRQKMEKIKWVLHMGDPIELCFTLTEIFDVIDCSGLSDEVGLANMLSAAGKRLSEEAESVIFVETSSWSKFAPTVVCYVEEALCAPLAMLPTVYGLRLADPLPIGSSVRPESSTNTTVCLIWKRTQSYENVRPNYLASLNPWLKRLAYRCFSPNQQQQTLDDICGTECYTPMTFFYIAGSAAQRMNRGFDGFRQVQELSTELDPCSLLTWRTFSQWVWLSMFPRIADAHLDPEAADRIRQHLAQMAAVLLFSARVSFDRIEMKAFYEAKTKSMGQPKLRLILLPHVVYGDLPMDKPLDISQYASVAHCIDNILLHFNKNYTSGWVTVSFPLIADHGLSETHSGVIVDIQTGLPLIPLGPVRSLQTEPFTQSYPFADPGHTLPDELADPTPLDSIPSMSIVDCLETESQYIVTIYCCYKDEREGEGPLQFVPGLSWIMDHQPPCESVHHITLIMDQPFDSQTLTFAVPFPFIAETVVAMPYKPGEIRLFFEKAVYEPWPAQFISRADRVIGDFLLRDLDIHLEQQFDNIPTSSSNALHQIRLMISCLFRLVVKDNHTFFMIAELNAPSSDDDSSEPDWYLRIHLPIVSNKTGSPMLMLSAFDSSLAPKLVHRGKMSIHDINADFQRIYTDDANKETRSIPCFVTSTREESRLLRYILRLNSTKIGKDIQEYEAIPFWPFGENSPWLATFLSPCYADQPRPVSDIWSQLLLKNEGKRGEKHKQLEDITEHQYICASCHQSTKKAKRCGRCKAVHYCDAVCQRKNWTKHKRICTQAESN